MPEISSTEGRINPAIYRHAEEAKIIGRILVAFSELEFMTIECAGAASGLQSTIHRALYRLRNTSSRIDAADAFMRPTFDSLGITDDYDTMIGVIRYCLRIRNQYAHCNWVDDQGPAKAGLFFTDLQEWAQATDGSQYHWQHVDVPLLSRQEDYFVYVQSWLAYLDRERFFRDGKLSGNAFPKPPARERPPLHNPPIQHIPQWLTQDQKAQHVARALAAQGGAPTPTPAQQALDKARAEKKARKQADRDRAAQERLVPPADPGHQQ